MLEQQIQKKITTKLEREGWFVLKLIKCNKNGYPDLLAVKGNECFFIEVKREKGILSPLQKSRLREMKNLGINVKVWTDYEIDYKY
tara:strand:- start:1228 stop:1485 length:258 start_codon:yes stop_codon:yes gene_type:complete